MEKLYRRPESILLRAPHVANSLRGELATDTRARARARINYPENGDDDRKSRGLVAINNNDDAMATMILDINR